MKLTSDWRSAWRWYSMHALAVACAAQVAWLQVPEDLRSSLPSWLPPIVAILIFVLGFLGRLVDQPNHSHPDKRGAK